MELAIKDAAGRLQMPADLFERALGAGLRPLPIGLRHAVEAAALPAHHRDPFDRMLVAQARREGMTPADRRPGVRRYDVVTLPAS